jgi:cell division protein FtsL
MDLVAFIQAQPVASVIGSIYVSQNYLSAQKRIDSLLKIQTDRWSICISNNDSEDNLVTAYGCLLSVPDDRGRIGISFIHAVESGNELSADRVIILIGRLLSQKTIGHICDLIAGVAKGDVPANDLMGFLTEHFKQNSNSVLSATRHRVSPIKEIQQDCGGASITTWLAMAASHSRSPAPWEIYEEYSSYQTGIVSTISSFSNAKDRYLLSEYLYNINCVFQYDLITIESESQNLIRESTPLEVNPIRHNTKKVKIFNRQVLFFLTAIILILSIASLTNQTMSFKENNLELKNTIADLKNIIADLKTTINSMRR